MFYDRLGARFEINWGAIPNRIYIDKKRKSDLGSILGWCLGGVSGRSWAVRPLLHQGPAAEAEAGLA